MSAARNSVRMGDGGRGRLWSLLDMINFPIHGLCSLLSQLEVEERSASNQATLARIAGTETLLGIAPDAAAIAPRSYNERIEGWLKFAAHQAQMLELEATDHRIDLFTQRLRRPVEWADAASELRALREAIEGEIRYRYFYRYPKSKAQILLMFRAEWAEPLKAFPSIEREVEAGVDCYSLGHNTACVFHMMRAAEVGIRALAKERKVKTVRKQTPVEWGTWNDVLKEVHTALDRIRQATAGPKKDAALAFYNSATSDIRTLQDLYRDRTMHLRESYDEGQAQTAMLRVRAFLGTLASRLSEDQAKPIRWGL